MEYRKLSSYKRKRNRKHRVVKRYYENRGYAYADMMAVLESLVL